ncbi:hypothetical protein QN277_016556 [Acacia crassicarpa]|uniref:TIR domain-containing protein n=1 Tax=Acacia crassicarpa TaxID=499986 RepID=A0AAE1MX05_9FABA|nr:hypothetical protein QN277_016556 [Acacia crassicarpa]
MDGVGKTTLARVVFEKLSHKFEICCFLEGVKNALPEGLVHLQKSLLSHLHIKDLEIYDSYKGMQMIRTRLSEKKVLLVLDDINDRRQLRNLAGSPDWFGKGSRIIITTRYKKVLTLLKVERIYEMKTMKNDTFNSTVQWEYDVFLSFAGKETRLNFTGHLYEALIRSGIRCFRDDVDLPKGEDINDLFREIQNSLCAVLVISQNYAKSAWCLDGLQKILESRKKLGGRIFPIFYNVNPADVREQRGSFGEALAKLEKKFKENTTKVQSWRTALSKIGDLSSWVIKDEHEADLIKNIVGDVWSFLSTKLPSFDDNLVGIHSEVADVIPFLEIGSDDKRFVGIWGMGGVGKTTLAKVVFEKLSYKFEICCFLENVKDALPKKGLLCLQKSLLSRLQIEEVLIFDSYEGMQKIREFLCNKKVLLVLDNIDDMSQLKDLAESPDWFGEGSRIIITTRDSHLLTSFGVERIYQMKTMNDDESLQIFSKYAFKKNHPEEKYLEYSKSVIKCAGGLPLALQNLGAYLCGRREEAVWRDALDKLKQINPYKNILQVLKLSYDGLDEKEQIIFLDIVCLFKRWKKEEVTQILKACDLNPVIGIKVLIEKTLLVEIEGGKLDMHDLYEDLGRYIIQQKSPNNRLRKFGEIKDVLENNKGYGEIEAIVLDNYYDEEKIRVHPEAFSKMTRLRLLLLNCEPNVPAGLKKLSSALKFVRWPRFPLETFPLPLDESMNHLKFINLSESPNFTETPDFSNVQSLGHLCLSRCASLVKVHDSLGVLKELFEVDLRGCENLNSLPSKLETNSLRKLDLGGCKNLEKLPEFGKGMKKLSYLDASHTAITTLPESLGSLTSLRWLDLRATGLINLPTDCFSGLFELVFLSLEGCKWLVSLPRLPPQLIRLETNGCYSMKRSLDEQLLNLVTSLDHECRGQTKYLISDEEENMPFPSEKYHDLPFKLKDVEPEYNLRNFFAIIPSGDQIPSWFDPNIKYYDEERYECKIEVDVPPNFRASKWSGIVVCLHLKGRDGLISWSSKAPEDDKYNSWAEWLHRIWSLRELDGLCVMVLEFNQKTCWQFLRDDNNSLQIRLFSRDKHGDVGYYIYGNFPKAPYILGYGWRVICKEDIQNWCHPNRFNQFIQPEHAPPSEVRIPSRLLRRVLGYRSLYDYGYSSLNEYDYSSLYDDDYSSLYDDGYSSGSSTCLDVIEGLINLGP